MTTHSIPGGRSAASRLTTASALLAAHAVALAFGLVGMLVMIPNPSLWAGSPALTGIFALSMEHAGALHILLGAAAMLAYGGRALGWRRTAVFFALSGAVSLGSELIGTGTGWPFGNYEYTEGLGAKVLGRVPYSIPLSWFYMGLACYLLGAELARSRGLRPRAAWSIGLGAYLMVVWDLVLDPAMVHEGLPVQFWVWHQTGPYFGMPLQNLLGWGVMAAVFMGLSRWLWGAEPDAAPARGRVPLLVYILNMLFGVVLSAAAGLWAPIVISTLLGVAPLLLRGHSPPRRPGSTELGARPVGLAS